MITRGTEQQINKDWPSSASPDAEIPSASTRYNGPSCEMARFLFDAEKLSVSTSGMSSFNEQMILLNLKFGSTIETIHANALTKSENQNRIARVLHARRGIAAGPNDGETRATNHFRVRDECRDDSTGGGISYCGAAKWAAGLTLASGVRPQFGPQISGSPARSEH